MPTISEKAVASASTKHNTKPSARWRLSPRQDTDLLTHLCRLRQLDPLLLEPDFSHHLHDPNLLPDMAVARALIIETRTNNQHVTIFGDYDADGTPAAALLSLVFEALGIEHQVLLPTRKDGYGLHLPTISKIAKTSQLLITVDNGITAVEEISQAKKLGLKVIVLDHHLPGQKLPAADAIIDPYLPSSAYPFPHLCGCALAYKLTEALAADFPEILTVSFRKWLLDLVAISTVADMMTMIGENRVLVHYGMKVLAKNRRLGLQALMDKVGIRPDQLTSSTLGFVIGPRLNASGRMGDNRPALDLLLAKSVAAAETAAELIEQANQDRKAMVEQVQAKARQELFQQNSPDDRFFIVVGESWPNGVLGLVAGKLAAEYHRPIIIGSINDGEIRASARSISSYSIVDALTKQSKLLINFGGHAQAAGLTFKAADLSALTAELKADAAKLLSADDLLPTFDVDLLLEDEEISLETAFLCGKLEPFGLGNPQPLVVIENVTLGLAKPLGAQGSHCKWQAQKNQTDFEVVGFGLHKAFQDNPMNEAHLLGYLEPNHWNNQTRLQFRLIDFQPTSYMMEKSPTPKK